MLFDITLQNAEKMHAPWDGAFLGDQRHGYGGYMTDEDPNWLRRRNAWKDRDEALARMRGDADLQEQAMTNKCSSTEILLDVSENYDCSTAGEDDRPIKGRKSTPCKG